MNNNELQQKIVNIQCLCNEILQSLSINDIQNAKQKSWLLHEVICTKFGENNETNKHN